MEDFYCKVVHYGIYTRYNNQGKGSGEKKPPAYCKGHRNQDGISSSYRIGNGYKSQNCRNGS